MEEKFISINKLALMLDVSTETIKRWYKWFEDDTSDHKDLKLPNYYYLDGRKTKFFKKEDVELFTKFQKQLNTTHRGIMSEFNANYQWGIRGKKMLKRKEERDNE